MQLSLLKRLARISVIIAGFIFLNTNLHAQTDVKIGSNPGNKTASAVLELESTTKGFLLPRMTAAQMSAISAPANGLAVYNTDQQCTYVYRGTSWVSLCDSATNGLSRVGNLIVLGGTLTGATTVTTTATNTFALNGLQSGLTTDSVAVVDPTTGVFKRRSAASLIGSLTADNGLTKNTATNVRLGGTLAQNTSIAQAGFNMNFSGGNVAIGTVSTPNSTLQLAGSLSVSNRKVTSNTTIGATDYIVLADASGGGFTLTLPAASSCSGRIYYVGKTDESSFAVTFSPALNLTESTTVSSLNFAKKYHIYSDGSSWWIYNE